jgi:hypothetical protein
VLFDAYAAACAVVLFDASSSFFIYLNFMLSFADWRYYVIEKIPDSEKRKRKKKIDDFVEIQRGALDKFLKINPSVLINSNNELQLAIVFVEEEEPTIGIFEEEEDINTNDNNVSAFMCYFLSMSPSVDESTNSSTKNAQPPSVYEPSFCSNDIYDMRNWDNIDNK